MKTNRLEAFSDGVFAVAITLLVLEIAVPTGDDLWRKLGDEWPSFASFLVSFWVIGIIWVNHHGVIDHLKQADRGRPPAQAPRQATVVPPAGGARSRSPRGGPAAG